jgi:uncharacterized protein (TIGR01777 family)
VDALARVIACGPAVAQRGGLGLDEGAVASLAAAQLADDRGIDGSAVTPGLLGRRAGDEDERGEGQGGECGHGEARHDLGHPKRCREGCRDVGVNLRRRPPVPFGEMRITLTGATGRIGISLVEALVARGDDVTVLSRNPDGARGKLPAGVDAVRWDPKAGPAPAEALAGRDAVVHLAGEDVGQRWNKRVKQEIVDSREQGTRNLVDGMRAAEPRPRVLVSASASGFYGPRGDEPVGEDQPAGEDFLSDVVVRWEREAERASELGLRVVKLRTGIVLDAEGGALSKMLTPFKLGAGGPVAGGRQYMPWIHLEDVVAMYLQAIDDERWTGLDQRRRAHAGHQQGVLQGARRALQRPAVSPVPSFAIKTLYGEMSTIVLNGVNMVPHRATDLGYRFRHPEIDEALSSTLAKA